MILMTILSSPNKKTLTNLEPRCSTTLTQKEKGVLLLELLLLRMVLIMKMISLMISWLLKSNMKQKITFQKDLIKKMILMGMESLMEMKERSRLKKLNTKSMMTSRTS
jgi:hypothetical protein